MGKFKGDMKRQQQKGSQKVYIFLFFLWNQEYIGTRRKFGQRFFL